MTVYVVRRKGGVAAINAWLQGQKNSTSALLSGKDPALDAQKFLNGESFSVASPRQIL